ncbi:MAG: cell division protein FtsA, partial [Pseudomonadota bacterium]|nr:cell division protein FtsA [Pseudomonadota bacterium]
MVNGSKIINGSKNGLIAAVDVGSAKIACFIAQPNGEGGVEVVGVGHQVSKGIKNGNISDMEAVEGSIRKAVEVAEQMAGENVKSIITSISGGVPKSNLISFDVSISGNEINDSDLKKALDPGWLHSQQPQDRQVIHTPPIGYSIDGNRGVRDPRGMHGDKLGVNMNIMTAGAAAMRNLEGCINRCHLEIESFVIAPHASGLGCLVEDEMELGAICIDMGAGTTTISVFIDGEVFFVDSLPVGGIHVTKDLARGLSTPLIYAERIKNLYGSATSNISDDHELIRIQLVGEDESETHQVPRSVIV